jgi:hypothetical protein
LTSGRGRKVPKDVALQVMVPPGVKRELNVRAAKEGLTQRTIVLKALRSIGLSVSDDDLHDRRKAR